MSYQYSPLPNPKEDIRILALKGDLNDKLITLYKNDRSLGDRFGLEIPRYEALSYTWGEHGAETGRRRNILSVDEKELSIQPNLAAALKRLRLKACDSPCSRLCPTCTRFLWIDAVCINQSDGLERTEQVAIMSWMYATAERTIVWLGEDDVDLRDGELSFAFLKNMARVSTIAQFEGSEPNPEDTVEGIIKTANKKFYGQPTIDVRAVVWTYTVGIFRHDESSEVDKFSMEILLNFLRRPWFSQRWVIQEVYQAKDVRMICGRHGMLWSEFSKVVTCMKCLALQLVEDPQNDARRNILSALDRFQAFECKEGSDRIAALSGLWSNPRSWTSFKVDYRETTEQNYIRFAEYMVHAGHLPQLLLCAAQRKAKTSSSSLPSWVPDWRWLS